MRKMFAFIDFSSVFVLFLFVGFIVSLNVLSLNSAYITHYFNFLGIGLVFLFIVVLTFLSINQIVCSIKPIMCG